MIIITDCEGPLTINDNAFELSRRFIPSGDQLFSNLSRYDDMLAYEIEKKGYNAGNTLKFLAPFLSANWVKNRDLEAFSKEHVSMLDEAEAFLVFAVKYNDAAYIVSTSYKPYINALCLLTGFPLDKTYSTDINLDSFVFTEAERDTVKRLEKRIVESTFFHHDLFLETIDEIITEDLRGPNIDKCLESINPIGGIGKEEAVHEICRVNNKKLNEVIYIGDSITDAGALRLVKNNGGLAIAFNGNSYAIEMAEISCTSDRTSDLIPLCDAFAAGGKSKVYTVVNNNDLVYDLIDQISLPYIVRRSDIFRRRLRGKTIGSLG